MATLEVESALQDAKIRQLSMLPEFIRLFSIVLKLRGRKWKTVTTDVEKPGDWGIVFETPNLRDLVSQAQARFLNAQADMMQNGVNTNSTQTNVTVGGASVEINGMKFPLNGLNRLSGSSRSSCEHHKELNRPTPWPELDKVEDEYEEKLKADWKGLQERVFEILRLSEDGKDKALNPPCPPLGKGGDNFHLGKGGDGFHLGKGGKEIFLSKGGKEIPDVPSADNFDFSEEQRKAIMQALKDLLGTYDWKDTNSAVRFYYGQAYSLGLIQAAKLLGKDRPILDIIKNREIFDEIAKNGFKLVKNNATSAIVDKIIPAIEDQVAAGANSRHVAARLEKLFGDKNSDWERLARSEMSMAAENAKIDEWGEWGVDTGKAVVPVKDTHPRCRCSNSVKDIDGKLIMVFVPAPDACPICMALAQ